jgi:long-chain fatty acid transport protein
MNSVSRAAAVGAALFCLSGLAVAGGFEVREQSAFFQGTSFAGAAAGGSSLSSIFWNPAASAYVGYGLTMDASAALVFANSQVNATKLVPPIGSCATFDCSVDIGGIALVPASYLSWRYDSRTVLALAVNSQFGLGTKPDNLEWLGQLQARSAKLFSINVNPSVSYEVAPGIAIGVGLQVQLLDLVHLKSATALAGPDPSASLSGQNTAVGFTAGINFRPMPGTSIGLGYRSSIRHNLEGSVVVEGVAGAPIEADVETPDKVTLSFSQAVAPNMRILGTIDWTNWSTLDVVHVKPAPTALGQTITLDFKWHDAWFFALGGEWDLNPKLTLRAGAAYETSPIRDPTERLVQLPDADRIWLSFGGSYKVNDATALNFGYSHVFVHDATLERGLTTGPAPVLFADTSGSVDIVSVGLTMTWGGAPPPMK